MRLRKVKIKNFRCYKEEVAIDLDDLTSLIGRNDIGKSTVLEALAIFFDNQKPDQDDACKHGDAQNMTITCIFDSLPDSIVIDASNKTSLEAEYLLNAEGQLEISRVYNGTIKTPTAKTHIKAHHPSSEGVSDLLSLKITELKQRARDLSINLEGVNQSVSAEIRKAIRDQSKDLALSEQLIEVDSQPGAKELYLNIKQTLPMLFIFRSDRPSTDQDSEAQDPMRVAVKLAIAQEKETLEKIADSVHAQVTELVTQTIQKIEEISPEIASKLSPQISEPRWDSIFKIGLNGDSGIPLNKRGSGIRRLVLLGFLQAQAESAKINVPNSGIIYAIEEPETSQHPDQQRSLLQALEEIAEQEGYQVIMTTHTPMLGRLLPSSSLRFISTNETGDRVVNPPGDETMKLVAKSLGVLPDHDVKAFVLIEGKHDENFLKVLSKILAANDETIDDLQELEREGKLIFVPGGGANLGLWVSRLHNLNRPEFHIFDRDYEPPLEPHYKEQADEVNQREGCKAVHTSKRELENYLHPQAVKLAREEVNLTDIKDFDDVPLLAAQSMHAAENPSTPWGSLSKNTRKKKVSKAKIWLNNEAIANMTTAMVAESDPNNEVTSWLQEISQLART